MLSVYIKTDSHYKVNRSRIRKTIEEILTEKKTKGNFEVSVTVVGDRMMKNLNKKFRNVDDTTDVLSFPLTDSKAKTSFIDPPDDTLRLGDIVISYPQAIDEAVEENKMVDDKIDELVRHAMMHLIGIHHD
ncbi:rRNA maturation RNase YbeY [Candidatus Gottesmanbacteria bacterium CG11_big_fil_rev_8_21_14_0_20_37_11]|uniref:rRNA maturation RNase YbeY n=3 Tax=Candidatus Gottesmaniibacteriota TaxID=1752720 RepID=A0A2M7RTM8_9BACT|nr:MAG: rRNA maturation RNase YbeY [Candidatus Gottesmanbacteria bacterium CG1_02_37_22]PIP33307.1 MAG: rRNA maturation RNase YbeY [Candidatus Gottesmanbacteria bacterium CG23_combo_of_CG06-09_8_20_14_all_37_19]PIR08813.1 MAG: rRNA maturation RNase YbeY [Candidatus Gottesmanbacteria bacterium CG11_big_fil_rev_8_21_14_0_20_37_11]PIZ03334.1 MAG: rRNA maturation RNase YbeY [Candidatus Gottesmanbacteria bacterium CG_4_10_14_0_8_um_filter_37_24]